MPAGLQLWLMRAGAAALALAGLVAALVPMGIAPGSWPSPDLVFMLVVLLLMRRPRAMPAWMLVPLTLASDLLRGAPLGIATLVLIGAGGAIEARRERMARAGLLAEWLTAATLFLGALAAQLVALRLTFLPWPAAADLLAYAAGTVLAYPPLRLVAGLVLPLGRERGGTA
ncbi:MAG: hypothetical protein KatS3mg118_2387 [Paracoccaceae bacterium]|nr:MAG: hypothetical protein KatS3mg118_2387 [Paracoccaceae bacterium]